ncbi:unnamed protein product [Ceratitis capitata]|uniref:(Mediterranean fruit fly) hypothetical protein n=1 Tax=Ceratitis capitata TaxID=7213 RepID=A0A811UA43_CERCA|nr:unnamed protein product [Ceratitis capitata]
MPQQKYQIQSQVGQPLQQNTQYQMQQQSTRSNLFQYSQTTSPPNKDDIGQLFSPLLPSYLDEDDLSYNFTRTCDLCCIRGQTPCENCCDSNPLISGAALKSAAG